MAFRPISSFFNSVLLYKIGITEYNHYVFGNCLKGGKMQSISTALDNFLQRKGLNKELQIAKLWANWSDIIGEELAKMAKPLGKRKETLVIGAVDNVVMQELVYHSEQILEQIEEFLGWKPFDKVVFELLDTKSSLDEIKVRHSYESPRTCHTTEQMGAYSEGKPEEKNTASSYKAFVEQLGKTSK